MKREDGGMTFYPGESPWIEPPAGKEKKGMKERLRFKIISRGGEIAAFLNQSDRDLCLGHFQEVYDDCQFEAKDEKK
jgi:hypothetical protein